MTALTDFIIPKDTTRRAVRSSTPLAGILCLIGLNNSEKKRARTREEALANKALLRPHLQHLLSRCDRRSKRSKPPYQEVKVR